ncbi:MAG: PQQ-binding-like beta-propeller repeat protein [Candidatus Brocadiia bacterium]
MRPSILVRVAAMVITVVCLCAAAGAEIGPLPPRTARPDKPPIEAKLAEISRMMNERFYDAAMDEIEKVCKENGNPVEGLRLAGLISMFSGTSKYDARIAELHDRSAADGYKGWNPETCRTYLSVLVSLERRKDALSFIKNIIENAKNFVDPAAMNDPNIPEQQRNPKTALRGSMMESISSFYASLGVPSVGGEEMNDALWGDWQKAAAGFLEVGAKLESAELYADAIVSYRRAALLSNNAEAAVVPLARCWMKVGEYEKAADAASLAATEEATKIKNAAVAKDPIYGAPRPDASPFAVTSVLGMMPEELHFIVISGKYYAGLTRTSGMKVFDKATHKQVFTYGATNIVPAGKSYLDVRPRLLACQRLVLAGDLVAGFFSDQMSKGGIGVVMVFRIADGVLLSSIEINLAPRTFSSVYMRGKYLFAVQMQGTRSWLSCYDCETGLLLWRNQNYDDIICPPRLFGDEVVLGVSTLGSGSLIRMKILDGTKMWSYDYEFARVGEGARKYYNLPQTNPEMYVIPLEGYIGEDFAELPANKKGEPIKVIKVNLKDGKPVGEIALPTPPYGTYKRNGDFALYLDDKDEMTLCDLSGKVYWRKRSACMHMMFDFSPDCVLLPESDGGKAVARDGTVILKTKDVPDGTVDGTRVYNSKMILNAGIDLSKVESYVDKLAGFAKSSFPPFDYEAEGTKAGVPQVSPAERILRSRRENDSALTYINLALARICKNQYWSNVKEYFTSYLASVADSPEKSRKLMEEFCPGFEFVWFERTASFSGAWDGNDLVYMDQNAGSLVFCDSKYNTVWRKTVEFKRSYFNALTPDGVLYFYPGEENGAGNVFFVKRSDGSQIWQQAYPWVVHTRQVRWHNGKLYIFVKRGAGTYYYVSMFCLDPADGRIIWEFTPPPPYASGQFSHHEFELDDEGVIFGATDSSVYKLALDSATPKVLWRTTSVGYNAERPQANFNTILVKNGKVFTTSYYDNLAYCLDAKDGHIIWSKPLPVKLAEETMRNPQADKPYWVGAPAKVCGNAFASVLDYNRQRSIIGFDTETGDMKWEFKRNLVLFFSMLSDEVDGMLYVPVFAYGMEKISAADGTLVQHLPLEVQTAYKVDDLMMLDFTNMGRLMLVRIKHIR